MSLEGDSVDVAVVGDGLIGLSIAFHLQGAGLNVAVLGGPAAGRASTAAAGILTPACEFDPWMCRPFLDLLKAGLDYYTEFLNSGWVTPEQVDFRRTDFTLLDLTERAESLSTRLEWMPKLGFDCDWLDSSELCDYEPNVSPAAFRGGIRIRDEAVVNPIALWEALRRVVTERGAKTAPGELVGIGERGERLVLSVRSGDHITADRVVVAAGAWSTQVARLAGLDLDVCPVKGQMVLLRGEPRLINSVIFMPAGGCGSVVERVAGTYIVGTSEEYLTPEDCNTPDVIGTILSRLCAVIPSAMRWSIEKMWAGFRPMTSDELPVVGTAHDRRFVVATGHHRNGILLAPITGRLVTGIISESGAGEELDLSPFRYGRPMRPHARFAAKY